MPDPAVTTALVVAGYVLGTFPTALLVGRSKGFDPTATGSGNPGASNATRVGGRRAGALVLIGDLGKGIVAAGLARLAVDDPTVWWLVGATAVAGHIWPFTRGFRGGKGVATAAGATLVCEPVLMLAAAVAFGAGLGLGRKAAVGSLAAAVVVPVGMAVLGRPGIDVAITAVMAVAIAVRHRSNLAELRSE